MIQETEDDRLDQSLRDTFSDFDLPPSSHVWAGIEGQLSALPESPRPVPLLLVLPLVGLVGVTIGWLLPRPATVNPAPRPATETAAKIRLASLRNQLPASQVMVYVIPRSSTQALAFPYTSKKVASSVAEPASKPAKVRSRNATSSSAPQPAQLASANTATPIDLLLPKVVSPTRKLLSLPTDTGVQAELPTVALVAPAVDQTLLILNTAAVAAPSASRKTAEAPEPGAKGEGLRERRPEYRMPTHRLAERGRGLRRIQNNFVKHWQHLFGSRRARVAAQPDF